MSRFVKVQTRLTDLDCLEAALKDSGLVCEKQTTAHGYGRARQQADLVVRKALLPRGCLGDLAFVRAPQTGTLDLVMDELDQRLPAVQAILSRLPQRHAYHRVMKQARMQGLAVQHVRKQGGVLQVVLRGA